MFEKVLKKLPAEKYLFNVTNYKNKHISNGATAFKSQRYEVCLAV